MKREVRWVWIACLATALGGGARLARADEASALAAGQKLFERHCALCHGSRGRGDGPLAEDLKVHPADLTGITAHHDGTFPETEISEIIDGRRHVRGHGNEMPVWGREFAQRTGDPAERTAAVREKISNLLAYLRSIQAAPQGGGH